MIARLPIDARAPASTGFGLTFAGRLLAAPTLALVLAGWLQGGFAALAASILSSAFLLSALASALHLRGLRIGSPPPTQADVGSIVTLPFPLKNVSRSRSLTALRIDTDRERNGAHPASGQLDWLAPEQTAVVRVGTRLAQRGRQTELTLVASSAFPLGLVRRVQRFALEVDLLGLPRTGRLAQFELQAPLARHHALEGRAQAGDDEVAGLRDWRPGDSMRRVHWRRSATREHLVLSELQRAAAPPLEILLDTDAPPGRSFERAVQIAATIFERTLRTERRCALRIGVAAETQTLSGPGALLEGRTLLALALSTNANREDSGTQTPVRDEGRRIVWVRASGRGRLESAPDLEPAASHVKIFDADAPHLARGLHAEADPA